MYKLRLKAGSVIHVQREDVTLARFDYCVQTAATT